MNSLVSSLDRRPGPSEVRPRPSWPGATDGQVETADLGRILWHRRRWIGGFVVLLVGATILYGLMTPWLYTASSQILIDPRDKVVVSNDVNPSSMAPDGGVTQVESQVKVLESTSVLLRAVAATGLAHDPEFNPPPGALGRLARTLGDHLGWPRPSESADRDITTALVSLKKRLAIKRADKVFVVDVTVTTRSPEKSARIANAIAQAYLDDQAAARSGAARDASDALVARLAAQKRGVDEAETAVERYKAEHGIVSAANGVLTSEQQLTDITSQLEAARSRTAELRARADQIEAARRSGASGEAISEALGSTVITQLRSRYAELVQREADLKAQLGPRHPSIASAISQRHDVGLLIGVEMDRIVRSARADVERASANEAALAQRLARLTRETLMSKQASVRLHELERDRDASRTVYASYLLRSQETREQATIDSSNARIITQALPPQERSWPLLGWLSIAAAGAGLGLGASAAFAAEYLRPSILSEGQLRTVLGMPVIPVVIPGDRRGPRGSRARVFGSGRPSLARTESAIDLVLRRVFASGSTRHATHGVQSVILVCGRGTEVRTTELACALAFGAANAGERVLLVKAPSREGRTTSMPGLSDVLRGEAPLDKVVTPLQGSTVMVLDQGTQKADSSDWRRPHGSATLFAQASRRFDIIVIDGGVAAENPRLATLVSDVEETFVVAETGLTRQGEVVSAVEAIAGMGGMVSAALLIEPWSRG